MLKRTVAVLLTLILAIMLLPKAALAADLPSPNPNGATIPSISASDTLAINDGTVTNNFGTITLNGPNGTVADNRGTVETNNGTVTGNNSVLTNNKGIVTSNNAGGTVANNEGIINANNNHAFVTNNYGTVYNNGGPLDLGTIQAFGTVTNNYGTVYNDRGLVRINYSTGVANSGVVYNDHGQVDENGPGSTVHTFGGKVFDNAGIVNRYGAGGIVANTGGTTYQYWRVTISGTSAEHVEVSGVTDTLFNAKWARADTGVTLTPESGYYFTSPPTATEASVTQDGENYKVTNITADTVITINGVSTATPVDFSGLTANGSGTETTSLLTLTFDRGITDLAVGDLTVTGATKGTLTKVEGETGVYTLSVSDITVADQGSVRVAVQKHSFAFTPANKTVAVRKYTPAPATYTVTYNANGGTGTMANGAATQETAFALPDCGFTAPAGKRFKEWAIGSTSGTKVTAGGAHTFTANTTVYAIWEDIPPATYTVTLNFQKDGAAYAGLSVSIENPDSTYSLAENAGGSGTYTNAAVPNGTYAILLDGESTGKAVTVNGASGSATLEYFTVTFNANDGTPTPPAQVVIKGGKATAPTVSKASFTLDGWYSDSALTTLWDFDTNTLTDTTALYAKWLSDSTAPAFTAHPTAQTVAEGTAATFTVTAAGNPAPTLQWQVSTDSGANWSNITGVTSASYTTPATTIAMDGYQYRCIASNGTLPDATSNTATLTVNAAPVVVPTVSVSPVRAFAQGAAPEITITVDAGIAVIGLGNLRNVQMGAQGGTLTLLQDGTDYTARSGSIVLTLRQAYLNTLTPGAYTLQINLRGAGYPSFVQTTIIVNAPGAGGDAGSEDVPRTGDGAPIALCIGSAILAGALLIKRRTQQKAERDAPLS